MTKEALFMAFDTVDGEMVADAAAASTRKRAPIWLRWGAAAACVCLIAAGSFALKILPLPGLAGGSIELGEPGGNWPEGIDPKVASIAVFPDSESLEDVANATMRSVSEEEAFAVEGLGDLLPVDLPEGYGFYHASLYETIMNSGRCYHMLRVEYALGSPASPDPEDPSATVPPVFDGFYLFLTDFSPKTDKPIYVYTPMTPDEMHYMVATYPKSEGNGTFYLQCGELYIGVEPLGLDESQISQLLSVILRGYSYQGTK